MTDASRLEEEFLRLGLQYYLAGRSAARAGLVPIYGNLLHHAIEMLMKGALARKYSAEQLRKRFGHELPKMWSTFKTMFPRSDFSGFDATVTTLHQFKEVRYPDKILQRGAVMTVHWWSALAGQNALFATRGLPFHGVVVEDVDRLVVSILQSLGKRLETFVPTITHFRYGRGAIRFRNRLARQFLPRARKSQRGSKEKPRR